MAKSQRRIAPYELIDKARFKSAQQKALSSIGQKKEPETQKAEPPCASYVPLRRESQDTAADEAKKGAEKTELPVKAGPVWGTRPKAVRLYPDRIELCFSWQVMVIGLLALAAILMVFFRLGQLYSLKKSEAKKSAQAVVALEKIMPQPKTAETAPVPNNEQKPPKMVEPMGDHVIVIASHDLSSHLEPVKQYFAEFGIATEIIKKGTRWLLVTQERFDNPDKAGSNGFEMRKKIISIGANYKPAAASGFEPFGIKPFQDAYGMKIN